MSACWAILGALCHSRKGKAQVIGISPARWALSGTLASGVGYVIWYAALPGLTATRAATVQLVVPVLTAFAGVVFLSEQIIPRLVLAAILILGGVGLAVAGHRPSPQS